MAGELITVKDFHSSALAGKRTLVLYLPPGYRRDTRRRYPVLYLHDGQNVFDGRTSYVPGQYWRMKEAADSLLEQRRIEPPIIDRKSTTSELQSPIDISYAVFCLDRKSVV